MIPMLVPTMTVTVPLDAHTPQLNAMTTTNVQKTAAALSEDVSMNQLTAAILTLVLMITVSQQKVAYTKTSFAMITTNVPTTTVTHILDVNI
jgi:hypothetical protein